MKTIKEISNLTGVSVRTLQYYDIIDLLKPSNYTLSGYRQYDSVALIKLQ
ncbi:MerR family DNA-binding transcriptional regulator [Lysinibacillus sp. NPDC096212]